MRVFVALDFEDRILQFEVDAQESVENVKALVEVETGIPLAAQSALFGGAVQENTQTLDAAGLADGDTILISRVSNAQRPPQPRDSSAGAAAGATAEPSHVNADALRRALQQLPRGQPPSGRVAVGPGGRELSVDAPVNSLSIFDTPAQLLAWSRHPEDDAAARRRKLGELQAVFPPLAEALAQGNEGAVAQVLGQVRNDQMRQVLQKARDEAAMRANPDSPEAQQAMLAAIQRQNIAANRELALVRHPESFAKVTMLYILVRVHNTSVVAFVDTGAQMTLMTRKCAEKCNLLHLLDVQFGGLARGVGQRKVLGRIHSVEIGVGGGVFSCTLNVLEDSVFGEPDFLLGLDMLRKHEAVIALNAARPTLTFSGALPVTVPFLTDAELKDLGASTWDEG